MDPRRNLWDPVEMRNLPAIQRFRHSLMLLAAIPGQPNAYGAFAFFQKNLVALRIRKTHFFECLVLSMFGPLGPSPRCRGVDLESSAIIGVEIGEVRSKYEIWQ